MSVKQNEKTRSESPPPPWIKYPGKAPYWGGWRQGESEFWLLNVWLPFWRDVTENERQAFLKKEPPPNDEWRDYITQRWR